MIRFFQPSVGTNYKLSPLYFITAIKKNCQLASSHPRLATFWGTARNIGCTQYKEPLTQKNNGFSGVCFFDAVSV